MPTLFLYEYCCAVAESAAPSLVQEGRAMLRGLLDDFQRIPGVKVLTLASDRFPDFQAQVRKAEASIIIAPETAGILEERSQWVLEAGGILWSCSPESIARAGDKLRTAQHLQVHSIPTPPILAHSGSESIRVVPRIPGDRFPVVIKPLDGAGSQETQLVLQAEDFLSVWNQFQEDNPGRKFLAQPYCFGTPASVAFLLGPGKVIPLLPCEQILSTDGRFHYQGGRLPLPAPEAERARQLAERAVQSLPGLAGFVGVDLVLGSCPDEDVVIEINPRLTTSYLGLRALAQINLAEIWLRLMQGQEVGLPTWKPGPIRFFPDGGIE